MSKQSKQRKIVIQNGSRLYSRATANVVLTMWNRRMNRGIGKVHRADRMMMRPWKLRLGQLQESLLLFTLLQEGTNHVTAEKFCLTARNTIDYRTLYIHRTC